MNDALDPEILSEFVSESRQGLQNVEHDLLSLEADGGSDVALVNRIFRAVHSVKGAASFLQLSNLVTVSHAAETLLDDVRSGRRSANAEVSDAVLGAIDALLAMLDSADVGAHYECNQVLAQLEAVLNSGVPSVPVNSLPDSLPAPAENMNHSLQATNAASATDFPADRDPELLAEFISESQQGIKAIEQDLLELETVGSGDKELVNRIFRTIHSMKGAASFLALDNLVSITHRAETILDRLRGDTLETSSAVTSAVLSVVDAVSAMLQSEDYGASYDCTDIISKLDAALSGAPQPTPSSPIPADALAALSSATDIVQPVYRLHIDLEALHAAIDIKEGVVEGLKSVGKIRHTSLPLESIDTTLQGLCDIYFETVLEPALLSNHFAIPLASIEQLEFGRSAPKANASGGGKANPAIDPTEPIRTSNTASSKLPSNPADSVAKSTQPTSKSLSQPTNPKPPQSPASTAPTAAASTAASTAAHATRASDEQTMRVPARILHELLEWTGNMVMARNQLLNEYDFRDSNAFRTLSQAITGVHETVIETRMQTTGSLFERYRRVVRDLSRQLKKEVAFHIEGGDLELDRTILESFADPLTHLVRNCIDHALETPEERAAAGKNRQGNVYLRSYIQSGEIILSVQDDGRGISADYVSSKAVAKGLITATQAAEMSEEEKIMLVFRPGFSTKDQATDVSGRGVGMDVVKNNIEKVGGTIAVKTRVGEGSTFSAHLPLAKALVSSSLTKALIIKIADEQFAIPETAISEIIQYDSRAMDNVRLFDGRCAYQHREQLVAIIDLRQPLGIDNDQSPNTVKNPKGGKQPAAPQPHGKQSCLVIIQFRDQLFGTVVDEVVGMQEIIVRSNPKLLENCTVYSGHTVLGTGLIALILDINGIVNKLKLKFPPQSGKSKDEHRKLLEPKHAVTTQKMLIFNISDDEFFAIPIELVAFIERIQHSDLRRVGKKEFCQLKSETLTIVRLEDFLPVTKPSDQRREMCLIRPAAIEHPIGVLTGLELTVADVAETFETRLEDSNGIMGTFYYNRQLVMLLDLFSILEKYAPEKLNSGDDSTSQARILVAEDSLFFRKLINQYITRDEWEVELVNDGQEAYERLMNDPNRFDLFISDINMPRMDGFELVKRLREDRRFDSMPIVALTTMSDDHFREKGLALGFDRYVIKIDKREVRTTVSECLRIKRPGKRTTAGISKPTS